MSVRRIGLDIGATAVRMVEVEFSNKNSAVSGRGTVVAFGQASVPRGAVQSGEVRDVASVSSAIKRAHGAGKFSTKEVQIGVAAGSVAVREMELPSLPMEDLRRSLPFQVQEVLPMSTDEALVDFFPTSERQVEGRSLLRGILVAAPKSIVSQNIMAVQSAGFRPTMVDLNAFALLRAQMTDELRGDVVALVDIGSKVTNVIIVQQGVPRLVRTLPAGGQDVTDAVSGALHVDPEEAENIKASVGMGGGSAGGEQHPAQPMIADTTRSLVESIRNTFVFYSGNNPGANIGRVVLTGGGALLPGLGQYLATSSRLSVNYGNALSRVNVSKKIAKATMAYQETRIPIAVGLAFGEAS